MLILIWAVDLGFDPSMLQPLPLFTSFHLLSPLFTSFHQTLTLALTLSQPEEPECPRGHPLQVYRCLGGTCDNCGKGCEPGEVHNPYPADSQPNLCAIPKPNLAWRW